MIENQKAPYIRRLRSLILESSYIPHEEHLWVAQVEQPFDLPATTLPSLCAAKSEIARAV
jgi:hypothetical protein